MKQAEREKAALSISALAARQLYEMNEKEKNINKVTDKEVENLLDNLEMTEMEFLATLQAEIKRLFGKELKPIVIPDMYKVVLKAWGSIQQAKKNTEINKADLVKKAEFFISVYQMIVSNPQYKKLIPDLIKFEKLQ